MTNLLRGLAVATAIALAGVAGWQVVASSIADRLAARNPQRALAWDPHDPEAMLVLARRQLANHQPLAAADTARELLSYEPLEGEAFAVLAEAAESRGDIEGATRLYAIAVRRAPRDLHARSWVIRDELLKGHNAEALENLNIMLRISPSQGVKLFPIMARLADSPAFGNALANTLKTEPPWRQGMLDALVNSGGYGAIDRVFSALARQGNLKDEEAAQWFAYLMQQQKWGEAYSRWAGRVAVAGKTSLPLVYNGGFETDPRGMGFDWTLGGAAGVLIERVRDTGASSGYAAHLTFLGRRVPEPNFSHALLLAPGEYRLQFRARAADLRSDRGLEWLVSCANTTAPIAVSPPLGGSFAWKSVEIPFTVPPGNCPAQRLSLRNPGAEGAGKIVSGELWVSSFAIAPAAAGRHPDGRPSG